MWLIPRGLGHRAHIGLTEKLRKLVRRNHTRSGRAWRTAILHMTEVGRRGVHEILDLIREQANRLFEVTDGGLRIVAGSQ